MHVLIINKNKVSIQVVIQNLFQKEFNKYINEIVVVDAGSDNFEELVNFHYRKNIHFVQVSESRTDKSYLLKLGVNYLLNIKLEGRELLYDDDIIIHQPIFKKLFHAGEGNLILDWSLESVIKGWNFEGSDIINSLKFIAKFQHAGRAVHLLHSIEERESYCNTHILMVWSSDNDFYPRNKPQNNSLGLMPAESRKLKNLFHNPQFANFTFTYETANFNRTVQKSVQAA